MVEYSSLTIQIIKDIAIPLLAVLAAIIGSYHAISAYKTNTRIRKAEWLFSLFREYYQEDRYKRIRQLLDYGPPEKLENLKESLFDEEVSTLSLEEELIDYLNFFQFVAVLWDMKQIKLEEIKPLFNYYLKNLLKHDFIVNYIEEQEFFLLSKMLQVITDEKAK